ncbi:MAG: hypothetical protein ACRYGK_17760 [Janthinobacterium lividum]
MNTIKKTLALSLFAATAFGTIGAPAMAQGMQTPAVDAHQLALYARIDRGISAGLITREESQRLHERDAEIQRMEVDFRRDGKVTRAEREQLRRAVASLDADVDRKLANGRRHEMRTGS